MRDLYERLELRPGASREEIVKAYRRLVHGAHPDARPGDADAPRRFRELTEAYEVLSDPERRARYDRSRRPPIAGIVSRPPIWAGPVHVEPPPGAEDDTQSPIVRLLYELLASDWRW